MWTRRQSSPPRKLESGPQRIPRHVEDDCNDNQRSLNVGCYRAAGQFDVAKRHALPRKRGFHNACFPMTAGNGLEKQSAHLIER